MVNPNEDSRLVVTFENFPVLNETKSKELGRAYYDDMEVCRIRISGDRLNSPVFPAWSEAPGGMVNEEGYTVPATYKEKYAKQYEQFKRGEQQTKDGTPIEALPFLTAAKQKELKSLNIFTAEALASLDGQNLKALGQGGRDWKEQAQAYLDNAADSASATRLASENEYLRQQLEELRKERDQLRPLPSAPIAPDGPEDVPGISQFASWEDDLIKEYIKEKTGKLPKGNPSHETLVSMADALAAEPAR